MRVPRAAIVEVVAMVFPGFCRRLCSAVCSQRLRWGTGSHTTVTRPNRAQPCCTAARHCMPRTSRKNRKERHESRMKFGGEREEGGTGLQGLGAVPACPRRHDEGHGNALDGRGQHHTHCVRCSLGLVTTEENSPSPPSQEWDLHAQCATSNRKAPSASSSNRAAARMPSSARRGT